MGSLSFCSLWFGFVVRERGRDIQRERGGEREREREREGQRERERVLHFFNIRIHSSIALGTTDFFISLCRIRTGNTPPFKQRVVKTVRNKNVTVITRFLMCSRVIIMQQLS